jgi:hypothetical protein
MGTLSVGERTMRVCDWIACDSFPCQDTNRSAHYIPTIDICPEKISILLISEAAAPDPADNYYTSGSPLFAQTTIQAFKDAGAKISSTEELLALGVYMTTAIKCGKTGYGIAGSTIQSCSQLLEREIGLFSNIQAYLLMGDVAIKAINLIAKRNREPRVIPTGSTYKIRGENYKFRGARAFPSYLQAGPSFFIEKSKRRMIAEDIRAALKLVT